MIQASQPKPIETKAPVRAIESNKGQKAKTDSKESSDVSEFASELEASLGGEGSEAKVKAVEVSAEQVLELPSNLVSQPTGNIDSASPKVFDPALTKGVEQMIGPQTTEVAPIQEKVPALTDAQVLELANAEVILPTEVKSENLEALLKAPKLAQSGRAPAIDFAPTEVDSQLMNLDDFVAQKNLAVKKTMSNAYGMKAVPQDKKIALENGLKETQVVKELGATESPVNSQQFILNMMNEQEGGAQVSDTQASAKVFDMASVKSSNTNQIINQISDYVVQAKAAKEPTVNMRVNHEELGLIDITVSKTGVNNEAVAINIGTHSTDGKNFFQQNSKDLFSHLSTAGIKVSDLKVETPPQTAKSDFDFGSQQGRNQQGSQGQFNSEQNQRRHDQERRQDLWKLLNQEAA